MFNIYLGIYIIVAIVVIAGGTFKLYGGGGTFGAILFLIGSIFVFMTYGTKWFGKKGGIFSDTPVSWPPTINTCPDYLVYYKRQMTDGTTQDSCIDLIGVSKNGSIKLFPSDGSVPTTNDYYFSLATKSTDANGRTSELCQNTLTAGLTWEGITNGESCITPAGPVTPSGGGSNSGGGCPA
jgi:hypothetical protein